MLFFNKDWNFACVAVQTFVKEDRLLEDGEDKLSVVVASSKLELE